MATFITWALNCLGHDQAFFELPENRTWLFFAQWLRRFAAPQTWKLSVVEKGIEEPNTKRETGLGRRFAALTFLVQVWHPDRYGNNPRLRAKAEEKLKAINDAYDRLSARRSGAVPPPRQSTPPQEDTARTSQNSQSQTRDTKPPPPKSPPPPPPPTARADDSQEPPTASESDDKGLGRAIAAMPLAVFGLFIVVLIVVLGLRQGGEMAPTPTVPSDQAPSPQQAEQTGPTPSVTQYETPALQSPSPAVSTEDEDLSAMKAEIENRTAKKDAEFDRLQKWYDEGVSPQDESSYRAALAKAQEDEQEIETMILTYNLKKKSLQSQ